MRKIKLFLSLLMVMLVSVGNVWAEDEVVYTLTPATGSDNGYASAEDIDITDGETTITWSVMGNSKDYAPWRIGGKGITNAIRPIYSKNAISDNVTKVVVTHGTKTISTVSLKLYVYSSAAKAASGGSTDLISTVDGGTLSGSDVITFNRPTGHDWTGRFYRLEYCCTQSGSSNKYILFNEAKFYAEAAAPAYTITAQSNDESKGTVSLTGSVITGSPKSGCRYASPAYTVTSGTATVAQSGNAFTVTPSSDCTVRINFEAIPQYTVTWDNNGSTSTSQVLEGNKPVFPATPTSCDAISKTFIGWATEAWTSKLANLTGKTVYTSASAMPDVDAAVTYYAVFAKSSGSAGNLFEWEGGTSSALTALENVTASGLGTDYAEGNAPYRVKFDTEGDYIVITTSGAIESVAVGVKMLGGGNTSHIYVQEAEDAESDFSAVETLTISGAQNDVLNLETENAFKADSRAVKLLFNKGSNVGVGPITIAGAASASDYMTTCAAPTCEDLGTPVVSAPEITYNSAKLTWEAVANADKYLVKFNGVDQEATSNLYFDATGLAAETQYTYQVKALAAANQEDWCDGEFSDEANFTTEPAPSAILKLMENGNEVDGGSHTVSVPFPLPTEVSHTCGKTFVGWDDDEYCDHAPTYAPGANFTFADQTGVTLYAVYADVAPGTTTNIAYTDTETTTNMTGANDAALLGLDADEWSVIGAKGGNSNFPGLNKAKDIRLYYQSGDIGNTITITAPQAIESVALTFTGESYSNAWVKVGDELVTLSNGVYPINASSFVIGNANTTNVQVRISNIAVNFHGAQSNWATTCVDPLENPTFSLNPVVTPVEDKYTEAINVVITNNASEGKIYYTTNNQTPTSASTEYTGAITLNTCGTKTIKAIVISDNNQSEVVTATYEIAIPIPSVSAEDPYTEAEAVAVIDGGCYKNEDVYVTGTVASNGAAWYPNSGTYTITLENGFKFYYFYEGENEQAFTENYIAAGDVLVATGKLEKSGNTYRLAQGCYLVSRTPAQKTPIDSDIDNPITVADALGYIDQAATYDLTNVYVKGVASEDPDNQGTFNIHDADVDNTFQIYKGVLSQELIDAGVVVEENDTVIAVGELTKFYSTYEMAQGGEIVVVKKYVAPAVAVTGVEVDETATVKVGKTVQLTSTVLPVEATNQNVTWSVKEGSEAIAEVSETGLVTGLAEGVAIIIVTTEEGGFTDECTVTVNPIAPANTDIITAEGIGVSGTNSYSNWNPKSGFGTSSQFAGNSANAASPNIGAIQLRSKNNSGIVLTNSNGLMLKGLSVTVADGTNTLNVYAKATAYSSAADLYDTEKQGKLIGTVSATGAMTLEEGVSYDDNYQYIGMRSANGALYLNDITITWGDAVTPPAQTYNRDNLTPGNYATICLPNSGTIDGAKLFDIEYYDGTSTLYLLEVNGSAMEAGRPYIFLPSAESITVTYTGNEGADAGSFHGLVGSYSQQDVSLLAGDNYILWQNAYYLVNSTAYVGANRAYIHMADVPTTPQTQQVGQAPRRRVAMSVHGEQVATGMENLNASEKPVKLMIDGNIYIIRGEKLYDATGRLVK